MTHQSADRKYMCNELASHRNVVGTRALYTPPMQEYLALALTSVAVTSVGSHTVAFVGTERGTVKKVSPDFHFLRSNVSKTYKFSN